MISLFRDVVCEAYGITINEFDTAKKSLPVIEARILLYEFCIEEDISQKEIFMFMGRNVKTTQVYKDMVDGIVSDTFKKKYGVCKPYIRMISDRYKNPSAIHPIARYTRAEELRIMKAVISAIRYMRHYGDAKS